MKPEITIKIEDYRHIREVLDSAIKSLKVKRVESIYPRTVGDCCRVYAVMDRHDDELYKDILRLKSTFR